MSETLKNKLRAFYDGRIYPLLIAVLVVFGATTGFEVITMLLHTAILYGAFLLSDSIKPLLISILTFIYQISLVHAPQYPTRSDYYTTSWRIWAFGIMIAALIVGFVIFCARNKVFTRRSLASTPLLVPTFILSLGLLANGLFSGEWVVSNLVFALANTAVYLGVYLLVYNGFSEKDSSRELASHFSYIAMLAALIISSELVHLFLTNENVIKDGTIVKDQMALGWGIWNLIAVSLSILIPLIFYGIYTNKYPWLYFAAATLSYVMSVLTMSRNALVFSTLIYCACVLISCFVGKYKKHFRIITLVGIALIALMAFLLWDKIYTVLGDYFERGFSDNGRFDLWRGSFESFLEAPIFGSGFYGLNIDYIQFGFLPKMAHQTVFQLLGSRRPSGLRKTTFLVNSLAHRTTWLRSDFRYSARASTVLISTISNLDSYLKWRTRPCFSF